MEDINSFQVVVVGSCMIDLICYAPRLPNSGETLHGSKFALGYGGKGCNQCVASSKLGAKTALVAKLGDDTFGRDYLSDLKKNLVDTTYVELQQNQSSGMAQITVADTGENQIVIVAGANNYLTPSDVRRAKGIIEESSVLVCQLEIPNDATLEALKMKSKSEKGISIFNAAPAQANLDPLFYELPNIFCVNETEAELCTNQIVRSISDAKKAATLLLKKGCQQVIITLGESGAIYTSKSNSEILYVPTEKVISVDTTGAGDAFIGALAFYISNYTSLSMEEMISRACQVASVTVQKPGTQTSFPSLQDLPEKLVKKT